MKIVGHVNIRPAVVVEVANGNAQAKANFAAINARCGADVFKGIPVVAQQLVSREGIAGIADVCAAVIFGIVDGVVEEVTIQISIVIVVKKSSLGRKPHKIEAVFGSLFFEISFAVVDVQLVFTPHGFVLSHLAHVNIEFTIAVDIGHGNASRPAAILLNTRSGSGVFEAQSTLIDIEFVCPLIGRKKQIGKAIPRYITCGHPAAIVVVKIFDDVEAFGFG